MVKKSLIISLAIIILSLCCGISFATENNSNSINLGNEITQSINKTGDSIGNVSNAVFSGNMVEGAKNTITSGVNGVTNMMTNGMNNADRTMNRDMKNLENGMNRDNRTEENITSNDYGNYNTTRTEAQGTITNNNMTTTTWMWIIIVAAAIVIIAAIWFYATQDNND